MKAVWKNIKLGRGEGGGNFGEENQDFKNWGGEEYQVVGNFIHIWFPSEDLLNSHFKIVHQTGFTTPEPVSQTADAAKATLSANSGQALGSIPEESAVVAENAPGEVWKDDLLQNRCLQVL